MSFNMGILRSIRKRWYVVLFLILYLALAFHTFNFELEYDEARHAAQGYFFYDYFKTLLGGSFISVPDFLVSYAEKGYNIGWLALYDPPFHGILQGLVYLVLGSNAFSARSATMLLSLIGAIFLYKISKEMLKDRFQAYMTVAFYLVMPFGFFYFRKSLLPLPISLMMMGWYYFFFYKKPKNLVIGIGAYKISIDINLMISALFLTAATLMKYQSMIFAAAFIAAYSIYLLVKEMRAGKVSSLASMRRLESVSILMRFFISCLVFLILGAWWIKLSLLDYGLWQRVLFEGTERSREYNLAFFTFFFQETFRVTLYFASFALIPIISYLSKFKNGGERQKTFLSKNMREFIFMALIYVVATILISNKQLRYMVHALPFVFIFSVRGVADVSNFIGRKIRIKPIMAFCVISALFMTAFVIKDIQDMRDDFDAKGYESNELTEYLQAKGLSRYVLNIKASGAMHEAHYSFTPDLFILDAMRANKEHDPSNFRQLAETVYWSAVKPQYKEYLAKLDTMSKQIPLIIVLFKYDLENDIMVEPVGTELKNLGFEETELTYYKVYEKYAPS